MALTTISGLDIPYPGLLLELLAKPGIVLGVGSRAIQSPDNTVQSMELNCVGKL